jgi:hypothetical protein
VQNQHDRRRPSTERRFPPRCFLAACERTCGAVAIPTLARNVIGIPLKIEPDNAVGRAMSLRLVRVPEQGPFCPRIFRAGQYCRAPQHPGKILGMLLCWRLKPLQLSTECLGLVSAEHESLKRKHQRLEPKN